MYAGVDLLTATNLISYASLTSQNNIANIRPTVSMLWITVGNITINVITLH